MILLEMLGWLLGIFVYLVIGNLIIRCLNDVTVIQTEDLNGVKEPLVFMLGAMFPFVFIYLLIKEVSNYIYNKYIYNKYYN